MILPTEKRGVEAVNPHVLLIYGAPKVGKTSILEGLDSTLIIELEPNGASYISGMIVQANRPKEFNEILNAIEESNRKLGGYTYQRIAIDTITKMDRIN